jgi:hypothetical protein
MVDKSRISNKSMYSSNNQNIFFKLKRTLMYTAIHLVFEIYIQLNGLRTEKKST